MAQVNVEFNGDASGVAGAAAAAQAAIDSVHGKDVSINIKTTGSGGVHDAAAAMERHAAASNRASAGVRDHASASERAGAAARDHASSTDRATSSTRAHSAASQEASKAVGGLSQQAGAADRALGGLGGSTSRSGLTPLSKEADKAGGSLAGVATRAERAALAGERAGTALARMVTVGFAPLGSAAASAADSVGELSDVTGKLGSVGSTVGSTLTTLGTAFAYGAAGSGVLTAAVGALGVVGVGALGGVGVAAGLAGAGMASFAADSLKDSAKFQRSFEQIGKTAHLASQYVSEPVGDAMVAMAGKLANNGHLTQAGMGIANSLKAGFGEAAGVVMASSDKIVSAAGEAAFGFAKLTDQASPGVHAFLGQLPELTNQAVSGLSQVAQEFGNSSKQIEGATPSFGRMMSAVGGMGAELVHIGAGSITPFNEDMTSMARTATRMANQLEPAIKPSMSAFTNLADAGMGAIGALSPEIAGFANTLSENSPQMQSALTAIGRGMIGLGTGAVEGLAQAGPGIDNLGAQTERYAPAIGRDTGRAGGMVADFLAGGEQMIGSASESGESVKSAVDGFLGTTRDPTGRVTGWGQSAMGGRARSTWGYADDGSPGGSAPGGTGGGGFSMPWAIGGQQGPVSGPVSAGTAAQAGNLAAGAGGAQANRSFAPTAAAQVGAAAMPPMPALPQGGLASGAGAAATQFQNLSTAAQAAHAPVAQVGAAMASGASQMSAAPMAAAMQKTVSKAVDVAGGAASAGGASIGGAIGGGVGAGITSTQTVTDTIMRKHVLKVIDAGQVAGDIHSPSRKTRKMIGQPLGQGTALGVQDTFPAARDAMGGLLGHYANENKVAPVITIKGGKVAARAAQAGQGDPAAPLAGAAKQAAFKESPDSIAAGGARSVFDKGVQSWEAKPGVDLNSASSMGDLNSMIQSPLSGKQYGAMVSMQSALDQPGLNRNFQMFGARTEQNIMRNRPGAFDVAGGIADHLQDQKDQAKQLGVNSADGVAEGFGSRHPMVSRAGANVAKAGHKGYREEDDQNSPSAKWFGFAENSIAGAVNGMNASAPLLAAAGAGAAAVAQAATAGPMADAGLVAGYTWATNLETGISTQVKKSNYQAQAIPGGLGQAGILGLAGTGFLKAGSGAQSYKTPGNTSGVVTLAPASGGSGGEQTINLVHNLVHNDGTVEKIATKVTLDMFGKFKDAVAVQAR